MNIDTLTTSHQNTPDSSKLEPETWVLNYQIFCWLFLLYLVSQQIFRQSIFWGGVLSESLWMNWNNIFLKRLRWVRKSLHAFFGHGNCSKCLLQPMLKSRKFLQKFLIFCTILVLYMTLYYFCNETLLNLLRNLRQKV